MWSPLLWHFVKTRRAAQDKARPHGNVVVPGLHSAFAMTDSATWHCCWHLSATDAEPEAATKRQKSTFSGPTSAPLQTTHAASGGEENVGEKGSDTSGWGEEMEAVHRHGILEHVRAIVESSRERKGGRRVTIVINLFALVHTTSAWQRAF